MRLTMVPGETLYEYPVGLRLSDAAARAAYAMEFLRQACDPGADMGF